MRGGPQPKRLPMCLTVYLRWSPWQTVTGMTINPLYRKSPTEGRTLCEVVAYEVRALSSSPGRAVRTACSLRLWLWTIWHVVDVPLAASAVAVNP